MRLFCLLSDLSKGRWSSAAVKVFKLGDLLFALRQPKPFNTKSCVAVLPRSAYDSTIEVLSEHPSCEAE